MSKRIHFIAVGGSIMHNMAIALHKKGYKITGSDDEVYEPSKSRLQRYGLLPESNGWNISRITSDIDAIILGMHAKPDNPELHKAQELGLPVYSFPEYIYAQSENKQRVVIAGSHGKTSITSMVMHVLKHCQKPFDFAVGAQLDGFDEMVQLSDAPLIIIEGDEYLSSPIDRTPKFLKYHHHIGLISGISWDHINVFPTHQDYVHQFELFVNNTPEDGTLVYFTGDELVTSVVDKERKGATKIAYDTHNHIVKNDITYLIHDNNQVPINVFGKHNLQNLNGAKEVLKKIGISDEQFYDAIQSFNGAANRLETVFKNDNCLIFKDFAHAPSKVKATTRAVNEQFPKRHLIACLELHTFSSLTKSFLSQYEGCMQDAGEAAVYYNPKTIAHKGLEPICDEDIITAFNVPGLKVFDDKDALISYLRGYNWNNKNLLLMSSGNFGGLNYAEMNLTLGI